MPEIEFERQIIVLFDEQGTPTFALDREQDSFLGVAVTYELAEEKEIFSTCSEQFGLFNTRPLKNNEISNSRAERISDIVTQQPIQTIVRSLNLADSKFQQVVTLYEQFGNQLRKKHRQVGQRNIAQILHSQILSECVMKSIFNYVERRSTSSVFSVHIDNWSIPKDDLEIYLKERTQSIQHEVNSFYEKQGPHLSVRIPPISLLDEDSPRKRLVDVITSVVSRSFLRHNNARFSDVPLQRLLASDINNYEDITESEIDFMRRFMDDVLRNPPVG